MKGITSCAKRTSDDIVNGGYETLEELTDMDETELGEMFQTYLPEDR